MTVIALLEKPNSFDGHGLLGWVDCHDGSIVCDSAFKYFCMFLLWTYFAIMFPNRAYAVIATPANANLVASLVAAMFGAFALQALYIAAKSLLVRRALVNVREFIKPLTVELGANIAVERDASLQSGSRPAP